MPRSADQSDFVVHRPEPLPVATLQSHEASARATRIVYTLTFIVLTMLVLLCAIGAHIPSGQ